MSSPGYRGFAKRLLGWFPASAGIYQRVLSSGKPPADGYPLDELAQFLPSWAHAVSESSTIETGSKKSIFVFGYLRWWLEYGVALSLLVRRLGHQVSFGYLPYRRWAEPVQAFDARRQSEYIEHTLKPLADGLEVLDLSQPLSGKYGSEFTAAAEAQALIDIQYTLQREDPDLESDRETRRLFDLRFQRNLQAAKAFAYLAEKNRWETVLLPNGSILEFGVLYRMARSLGIRTVTYEFGEQRERIWLAVNDEVMLQDTSELWRQRGEQPLTEFESDALSTLYNARMAGRQWGTFARTWQSGEARGAEAIRQELSLTPDCTTVLLCTNVVGDSLALKRQIFTHGMADWLACSVKALSGRGDVNLIVRVHPGELLGAGHPSLDIVRETLPDLPDHVRLIPPDSPVNTYDLIDVADVGLVYTTTVGLEMAMRGLPVLVAGQTHYRGKGFTLDPATLEDYLSLVERVVEKPQAYKLEQDQIDRAWHYAYLFFFEYPKRFPWHLIDFWQDLQLRPFDQVIGLNILGQYQDALEMMTGSSIALDGDQDD